ncbi:MAG: methionine--tRNA ligase [Thermodesulfovibrionales bacterium]
MNRFYVTTPIYYVNDVPHIGHAYTTIAADILARWNRLKGIPTFFLTGTDEHGQKVEKAATERHRSPKEHADIMVKNFKGLWSRLNISHDAFIRTTDREHIEIVRSILQSLWEKGEIVKREYSGWYCTPDERFWTEKDIINGNCPECGRPVEMIHEENYFFLMSRYRDRLIKYIEDNPFYILPETRRNEVLGFLRAKPLEDLCISRPRQRLSWGIPLPFDEDYVTYVWFDALVNYYSATRYLAPSGDWWPATHHIIGKDILTTHAVYWSTMLMALDMPLPQNIFAHGWWTVDGKKMSKSLGNVVDPNVMADKYGVDAFRYFLFREVSFGLDGDFSEDALVRRINTDLANDLGNLLNRFLTMAVKYFDGNIEIHESRGAFEDECDNIIKYIISQDDTFRSHWSNLRFNIILEHIWRLIGLMNNHIAQKEPWRLAKDNIDELKLVMFQIWNALRLTALLLYPFMPETAEKIWRQIGLRSLTEEARQSRPLILTAQFPEIFYWNWKPSYEIRVSKGEHLFPRVEIREERQKPEESKERKMKEGVKELIAIDDFARVELRVGKVVTAERIEKSDKLLKLKVDIGTEERQIVAGIGKSYEPEYLMGKKVIVVTNLKPARLMGVESRGMLLAATGEDGQCSIITIDRDIREGSRVK